MGYNESARDTRVRTFLEANTWAQQFGQAADGSVYDGKTACTHTCWQLIALFVTGKRYTLDQINTFAGMPYKAKAANGQPRGMRIDEQQTLIKRLGLPYVYKANLTWAQIQSFGTRGPVLYGVRYGSEPDWKGKAGADGRPNGYARKFGRTQFVGAENIRHAVLFGLARGVTDASGRVVRTEILRRDPNHGSPARQERPPYDIISPAQANKEYQDITTVGGTRFAFVPTKDL